MNYFFEIMRALFVLVGYLLLIGCGEIIPCETDDLGKRENHTGSLRMDGVYISDSGGVWTRGGRESSSVYILYANGLYFDCKSVSEAEKKDIMATRQSPGPASLSSPQRNKLGLFWQRGSELLIHNWVPSYRPCNKSATQKGTILNDSTFQLYFHSYQGEDKTISLTFRLYPGVLKPDSTNDFIE